ncbi:S-layer homology domain-containing protein [Paenibacillus sp. SAF-054]|uniref:S-layer homology domain-containing protein n=1 Tax=unclassified Paenibacillus TaxID=185978 RepID=UPI003F7ECF57
MKQKLIFKVMTTAALFGAIALPVHAASATFGDIDGSYAKNAISELANKGIINGVGNGNFNPTGNIQRQDFAIILAKALNLDVTSAPATATFSDVPASSYAYQFVEAAAKAGLIKGMGEGKFGNGQNLTRQDMAVLFVRSIQSLTDLNISGKGASLQFTDKDIIADYAKDAVAAAVELKLLQGNTNGSFNPVGNADRQAVAQVAIQFLQVKEEIRNNENSPTKPSEETLETKPMPTVPTPTNTSSQPSSSGGTSNPNPGTPSTPDTTAPIVTLVSASPVQIGQDIKMRSSKPCTVYLVPSGQAPTSKELLDSLVSANMAVKASIVTANADTAVSTSSLYEGEYKLYVADSYGKVSSLSPPITLQAYALGRPSVSFSKGDTLVLRYGEDLDTGHVPTKDDLHVYSMDGSQAIPRAIKQIAIQGKSIEIILDSPLRMGDPYEISYQPQSQDATVRSISGKLASPLDHIQAIFAANKQLLSGLVAEAQALYDQAKDHIGDEAGEYSPILVEQMQQALADAGEVIADAEADQESISGAYNHLQSAYRELGSWQVPVQPLTLSLVANDFLLNLSGQGVYIVDNASPESYNKRNIKNLIKVTRNGNMESLTFNTEEKVFKVIDDKTKNVVGTIDMKLGNSNNPAVTIGSDSFGVRLTPINPSENNVNESLVFTLFEGSGSDKTERNSVSLPIRFDTTGPSVTSATYEQGVIKVTFDEAVSMEPYQSSLLPDIELQYSPDGSFDESTQDLTRNQDYTFALSDGGKELDISLISDIQPVAGAKFKITFLGFTDYARNNLQGDGVKVVDVP